MKQTLGLIEISGLFAAVVTVDIMAKVTNIRILEIKNMRSLGYTTIKIAGDVGVVNVAISTGKQTGAANSKLVPRKIIPRPSDYVEQVPCCPEPLVLPSPPVKKVQEEIGTGKTGETMRRSPETVGEPEPDGGQAGSVREETDSKDELQAEAEQPLEEEDFKPAGKPKKVSRRTSAAKGIGTTRSKNS